MRSWKFWWKKIPASIPEICCHLFSIFGGAEEILYTCCVHAELDMAAASIFRQRRSRCSSSFTVHDGNERFHICQHFTATSYHGVFIYIYQKTHYLSKTLSCVFCCAFLAFCRTVCVSCAVQELPRFHRPDSISPLNPQVISAHIWVWITQIYKLVRTNVFYFVQRN